MPANRTTDELDNAISFCRAEQRACQRELALGNPDRRGCIQGLQDWFAEELELERLKKVLK